MLSGTVVGPGPDHWVMEFIVIQSIAHKMRSILAIKFGTYKYRISFPYMENVNSILPSERPFFVKSRFVKPAAFRHSDLSGQQMISFREAAGIHRILALVNGIL